MYRGTRDELGILHQCGKRIKTKSQKFLAHLLKNNGEILM